MSIAMDVLKQVDKEGKVGALIICANNNRYGYRFRLVEGKIVKTDGGYVFRKVIHQNARIIVTHDVPLRNVEKYPSPVNGFKKPKFLKAAEINRGTLERTDMLFSYAEDDSSGARLMTEILLDFLHFTGVKNMDEVDKMIDEAIDIAQVYDLVSKQKSPS